VIGRLLYDHSPAKIEFGSTHWTESKGISRWQKTTENDHKMTVFDSSAHYRKMKTKEDSYVKQRWATNQINILNLGEENPFPEDLASMKKDVYFNICYD
jgi:hypothetical protein